MALDDFNRTIKLDSDDWHYYQLGLTHLLLNHRDEVQVNFTQAITTAQRHLEHDPADWRRHFNLAFYYLVASQTEDAARLYREGFQLAVPLDSLRAAQDDLTEWLHFFPEHLQAQAMHMELQQYIAERQKTQ